MDIPMNTQIKAGRSGGHVHLSVHEDGETVLTISHDRSDKSMSVTLSAAQAAEVAAALTA